jgi:hypothetical protein
MRLDNNNKINGLKMIRMLINLLFILLIALSAFDIFPIGKIYSIPTLAFLYILFLIFWQMRKYIYIIYSDSGNYIIVKYLEKNGIIGEKKAKMIKIDKSQLLKFEIIETLFGRNLVLHQKIKSGIHIYPYISISAFTQKQINDLKKSLSEYAQQ